MTTGFEPYSAPKQRVGDDAVDTAPVSWVGHPRPARAAEPQLPGERSHVAYPVATDLPPPLHPPRPRHQPPNHLPPPATQLTPPVGQGRLRRAAAAFVVLCLVIVAGWQAYQLDRLDARLDAADRALAQADAAGRQRTDALGGRISDLERQAGRAFDPEAVSTAVLPSVFRVRAGRFTGTAFAVGDSAEDGGSNLLTNFHVVEAVWADGDRTVTLEQRDESMTARILAVDRGADLAHLVITEPVSGLAAGPAEVKPGQQVVVIGAPLGLEDTVTTGVVSAVRNDDDRPMIQFDAPINPGNSGGPVVNAAKQVVGIATAKARDAEGIGLAVPIQQACRELDVC